MERFPQEFFQSSSSESLQSSDKKKKKKLLWKSSISTKANGSAHTSEVTRGVESDVTERQVTNSEVKGGLREVVKVKISL